MPSLVRVVIKEIMKFITYAPHSLLHTDLRYHIWFPQLFPLLGEARTHAPFQEVPRVFFYGSQPFFTASRIETRLFSEPNRSNPQTTSLKIYSRTSIIRTSIIRNVKYPNPHFLRSMFKQRRISDYFTH